MTAQTTQAPQSSHEEQASNARWQARHDAVLTPNYGTRRLALVRGEGSRVWDAGGKGYLDFLTGIAVNNLGHCHPAITKAIQKQAETLVHVSNLYYIAPQIELAELLTGNSFADRVFFANTGAEANEAAIKIARRWSFENQGERADRHRILCMNDSFHGRTHATMAATGQEKVHNHFFPRAAGFDFATFNDIESVRGAMTPDTCAIMLEPVQGEGGLRPATPEFLRGVRELCDEHNLLLIFDEVQCGLGRTGQLFAHEHYGVQPDVMTLAKSLGGGMAMGAMLCTENVSGAFGLGAHASTMGGNPLASAAAQAYVRELLDGGHMHNATAMGEQIIDRIRGEFADSDEVVEVRGLGLMLGIEVKDGGPVIVEAAEEAGLLINCTAGQTLRLVPPLNVSADDVDTALGILIPLIRKHAGA